MNWNRWLTIALNLLLIGCVANAALAEEPFPAAKPAETGVQPQAIELLSAHVDKLLEQDAFVGGELHIIKNRKTIFRRAYGWAEREQQQPVETGTVYCIRSMTKPTVGTAIQMLIDDGTLTLEKRVCEILPTFDQPTLRDITIEHLLTHTSGLPMTAIHKPLTEYRSLADVAADAAKVGVDFEPGSSFQYSDAGSDTLGAIVDAVAGQSAASFIESRLLEPLGMKDARTLLDASNMPHIPSAYSGGTGNWVHHWRPTDKPLFPLFLTSQGLYCTTSDYAKFMTLWMDKGVHDGTPLLSKVAVERALAPGSPIRGYPHGFGKLKLSYGQQWMVFHDEESPTPVIFGHNGSDGTYAYAWPKQDLIVLFFTQSRGTTAGIELEPALQQLLVEQDIDGYRKDFAAQEAAEASFQQYEGIYWDQDVDDAYYVISLEKDQLFLERPGRVRIAAKPTGEKGVFKAGGMLKLEFDNSNNPSTEMLMTAGRQERQVRHQPDSNLPSVDDVISRVTAAHGIDALKDAGVIKRSGTIKMGLLGFRGSITHWFDRLRSRTEIKMGTRTIVVVTNGDEAATTGADGTLALMTGAARQQEVLGHPALLYGEWRRGYEQIEVLKQLKDTDALLIRAKPAGIPGISLIVDNASGRVISDKRIQFAAGMGYVGSETTFSDFRETAGVTLPFKISTKHSSALLGTITVTFDKIESGVSSEGLFDL